MARVLNDDELKAVMKALMEVWQKGQDEPIGLNVPLALLCKCEVGEKMDALLNGDDNYEYHLRESELFDSNMDEMTEDYYNKKKQQEEHDKEINSIVEGMSVSDNGDGSLAVKFDGKNDKNE